MRQSSVYRVQSSGKVKTCGTLAFAVAVSCLLIADNCFSGASKTGFRFLERSPGARQAAMGDAAVSLADDAGAVLWNPAGLADQRQKELSLGYAKFLDEMGAGTFSYAHPLSEGAVGLAAYSLDSGPIEGYAAGDVKTTAFEVKDSFFSFGWGRPLGERLRGGAAVKRVSESIGGYSADAVAFDAGALLSLPSPAGWSVSLAAAMRNQGGKASFLSEKTPLPASASAGLSVRGLSEALLLGAEFHKPSDGPSRLRAGGELWLRDALAVRAGYKSGRASGGGLTLGAGFRLRRGLQVDYAFAAEGDGFGATHHAGITLRFGGPADRAYQEGVRLAQKGDFAEAILKFEAALDIDPGHAGAVRGLREAVRELDRQMGRELNQSKEGK